MRQRRGFTLFEVVLAIALSAVALFLVAMAIRVTMRATDTRRAQIEEAQLARAILQRIADDLRNTVQYKAIDFSSVEELTGFGVTADLQGALEGEGDLGEDPTLEEEEETEEEPIEIAGQLAPSNTPGLYGNRYELQLDISRLPRIDEYSQVVLNGQTLTPTDLPSDIKTVAYYLAQGNVEGAATAAQGAETEFSADSFANPNAEMMTARGLIRRSLDRAVTMYAVENGNTDLLGGAGDILAPEVVALEFRYTDGETWYEQWSTAERGGLPVAVEIAVGIDMRAGRQEEVRITSSQLLGDTRESPQEMVVYRLLVHLPVAEIPSEEELLEEEAAAEEFAP